MRSVKRCSRKAYSKTSQFMLFIGGISLCICTLQLMFNSKQAGVELFSVQKLHGKAPMKYLSAHRTGLQYQGIRKACLCDLFNCEDHFLFISLSAVQIIRHFIYFYSGILILNYYYHLFYILSGNCLLLEYNSIRYNLIFSEGILAKSSTAAVCQLLFGEVQGALQQRQ